MAWGKWILGGLGWAVGGPIGALLGIVLGSVVDGIFKGGSHTLPGGGNTSSYTHTYTRTQRPGTTSGDIRVSLLVLIACVMKADGHVKKAELDTVKRFLSQNFSQSESLEALQLLKKLLEQNMDYVAIARQVGQNTNYSTRLTIIQFLLSLAASDGDFAAVEEEMVHKIAQCMNVTEADYDSMVAIYKPTKDPNWAYQVLEISPSASDDEVKKAYRRMAMKYHPDKVASAGDDIKQKATEKFRAINEAYEHIKTLRNIK